MGESWHCCGVDAAVPGLEIVGVRPGCAMLELAADAGVPAEAVHLGAGLLRRVARTDARLASDLPLIERGCGWLCGRVDASNLALTMVMIVYATCVCLANKAYGHVKLPKQRLCLRRWTHELTGRLTPAPLLRQLELGCLAALGWRL